MLPRRWVVERTFAWFGRNRRLAKDFETTINSSQAWLYLASIQLLTRRLARINPTSNECLSATATTLAIHSQALTPTADTCHAYTDAMLAGDKTMAPALGG